jgi:uncharacterized circularly permuted ATP-grasp superfamily protein
MDAARVMRRQELVDAACLQGGVTFSVYSDNRGEEKIFPFDLVPRAIDHSEWLQLQSGLQQRVIALNEFLRDIYGPQKIITDGIIPREVIERCSGYEPLVQGVVPPGGVWVHISGIDLIRDGEGRFLVLEDNLRCPSGVSYVLENRALMKRAFPAAFEKLPIASVEQYPVRLKELMETARPKSTASEDARPVILTPGRFNSAYFEHGFLARRSGAELVEGPDLFVKGDRLYLRTTGGSRLVDVMYRRVDDAFMDPKTFNKESLLGVPGLFDVYKAGNLTLMNAIGNGVADDKAIYPYVPDIIKYYLKQDAILGQVETYRCVEPAHLQHVLANLASLVVKKVDGAGGYGMLFGPRSTQAERDEFAIALKANPAQYVGQPVVELSTCPVTDGDHMRACRVDLRPYMLMSGPKDVWALPGGLTRVALEAGSYVVNSSQGGGSKDTWILGDSV